MLPNLLRAIFVLAALALAVVAVPAGGSAQEATCNGLTPTIVNDADGAYVAGTSGPDVILATGIYQTVEGLGGDDVICATGSGSVVRAGAGGGVSTLAVVG